MSETTKIQRLGKMLRDAGYLAALYSAGYGWHVNRADIILLDSIGLLIFVVVIYAVPPIFLGHAAKYILEGS